jgi:hypothetical protein
MKETHPFDKFWTGTGSDDYKHLLETKQHREAARVAWNAAIDACSKSLRDQGEVITGLSAPSNKRVSRIDKKVERQKLEHASGEIMKVAVQEDLAGGDPEYIDRETILDLFRED